MTKTICIIGLGYVGFPLACLCAKRGYEVIGVDKNPKIVNNINNGTCPFKDEQLEKDFKNLKNKFKAYLTIPEIISKDIFIICVPTPINEINIPNLNFVSSATKEIKKHLKKGNLIIVESTVYPGTIETIVKPILEKTDLKISEDFYLAHCPERIDPGNKKWTLETLPRVLGADSEKGMELAYNFYNSLINASITKMKSIKTTEAVKIIENAFRDINIAFVNELAKSFDRLDIDIIDVIKGASTKPFAFLSHYPGCGVGGHCIPIDPYYLIDRAKRKGFEHQFLNIARKINNSMPAYTAYTMQDELNKLGMSLKDARVGLLGIAYKKDVEDTRESPYYKIKKILLNKLAIVESYDPNVLSESTCKSFNELLQKVDYLLLVTDHDEFKNMNYEKLKINRIKLIIDGRNCLDKQKLINMGIAYKGIGR